MFISNISFIKLVLSIKSYKPENFCRIFEKKTENPLKAKKS